MKKHIITSTIFLLSMIGVVHAQSENTVPSETSKNQRNSSELFEQQVKIQNAGVKNIEYYVIVEKNQQTLYSGTVFLKNSVSTSIFLIAMQDEAMSQEQTKQYTQADTKTQDMNKTIEKKLIEENLLLKLTVHVSQDNKNMWSDFLFQQTNQEENGSIKGSTTQSNNEKVLSLNMSPENHSSQKEFIIAHINQQETIFSEKDYKITLKAKIVK